MAAEAQHAVSGVALFALALERARADFLEMPGLRLTTEQARRLWTLESRLCDAVLTELEASRFLARSRNGSFVRADASMLRG